MKRYFISADIHGFYDEWMNALNEKGFDINNEDHIIMVLGDIFDRGPKNNQVYTFLKNLPSNRRILIRGNHEFLLNELINKGYPEDYDRHNGTVDTVYQFYGYQSEKDFTKLYYRDQAKYDLKDMNARIEFQHKWGTKKAMIYKSPRLKNVLDWIFSDEWLNYYETEHYIFVHSFIPTIQDYNIKWGIPFKVGPERVREDWRNATLWEWSDATWGCPWAKAKNKLNPENKTIVCGHWHTSDFYNNLGKQKKVYTQEDNPIFKSKRYKLIGLDACTVVSHKVNVLVLNEDEL